LGLDDVGKQSLRFPDRLCFTEDTEFAAALLCSLMNIIFQYQPTGWMPYNYVMFNDLRRDLVMHCLHVLICLLDYKRVTSTLGEVEKVKIETNESLFGNTFDSNAEYTWSKNLNLQRNVFAILILSGFIRLMNNPLRAASTYLPGSMKGIIYYEELLILLWIILGNNKVRTLCISLPLNFCL
jgi:hypothetical protein